jgi:hypothetical protein
MSAHDEGMVSRGVVREWNDDEGFGVIDSPETPGGSEDQARTVRKFRRTS